MDLQYGFCTFPRQVNMPVNLHTITKTEMFLSVGILLLAAITVTRPSIHGNDGVGHFVYLASFLSDRDLDLRDEYDAYDDLKQYPYRFSELSVSPVTGLPGNRYGIGAALFWSPFVWTARLLAGNETDWFSKKGHLIDCRGVGYATTFWGSLALFLLYRRLRRNWTVAASGLTVIGLILATPLGFYLYAHGSMAHGVSFFLLTLAMLEFEKAWNRLQHHNLVLCGIWLSLALMTRYQDMTWGLVLGGSLLFKILVSSSQPELEKDSRSGREGPESRTGRDKMLNITCLILPAVVIFIPQMVCWNILYGSWFSGPTPYLDASHGSFSPGPVHALQVLFSERGGVLAWHPLILFGIIGLVAWRKGLVRNQDPINIFIAGFILQWILVSCWSIWWAGASFGNRFFISSLPFIALGIVPWFNAENKRLRFISVTGLFLLVAWNFGLLGQYATEMVPREDPVPWSRVIRQNLVDVPALVLDRLFH
jgi:hypothetical protein